MRCPDCESRLLIDAATGEVLSHDPIRTAPAGGKEFEELLEELDSSRLQAEKLFAREVAAQEDKDRLLEEKFREAMKRAASEPDDVPPPSPFDFD